VHFPKVSEHCSPEVLNICGGGRIISVNPEMCGFTSDPWDLWMSVTVRNPGELTYNPVLREVHS